MSFGLANFSSVKLLGVGYFGYVLITATVSPVLQRKCERPPQETIDGHCYGNQEIDDAASAVAFCTLCNYILVVGGLCE
jgi:uncharacterized membrane protein YiaA